MAGQVTAKGVHRRRNFQSYEITVAAAVEAVLVAVVFFRRRRRDCVANVETLDEGERERKVQQTTYYGICGG